MIESQCLECGANTYRGILAHFPKCANVKPGDHVLKVVGVWKSAQEPPQSRRVKKK